VSLSLWSLYYLSVNSVGCEVSQHDIKLTCKPTGYFHLLLSFYNHNQVYNTVYNSPQSKRNKAKSSHINTLQLWTCVCVWGGGVFLSFFLFPSFFLFFFVFLIFVCFFLFLFLQMQ
jgi:uncharacterized membrane protein